MTLAIFIAAVQTQADIRQPRERAQPAEWATATKNVNAASERNKEARKVCLDMRPPLTSSAVDTIQTRATALPPYADNGCRLASLHSRRMGMTTSASFHPNRKHTPDPSSRSHMHTPNYVWSSSDGAWRSRAAPNIEVVMPSRRVPEAYPALLLLLLLLMATASHDSSARDARGSAAGMGGLFPFTRDGRQARGEAMTVTPRPKACRQKFIKMDFAWQVPGRL
ncbi:hypothetical protein MAPG_04745 [Magnaporthiopsis poae ATCC 64411]|uniref:Uncharacterized protein n=1 Tax=Magnaporthiopsis poae (strain ATCC 64411 / 73-15) TaxID=644358 RepID=A0A0C4DXJ1_MAGP6|nr:hypothetical protein MAPG_04745 [Magnaporthiopsis poae ATCC 64411]